MPKNSENSGLFIGHLVFKLLWHKSSLAWGLECMFPRLLVWLLSTLPLYPLNCSSLLPIYPFFADMSSIVTLNYFWIMPPDNSFLDIEPDSDFSLALWEKRAVPSVSIYLSPYLLLSCWVTCAGYLTSLSQFLLFLKWGQYYHLPYIALVKVVRWFGSWKGLHSQQRASTARVMSTFRCLPGHWLPPLPVSHSKLTLNFHSSHFTIFYDLWQFQCLKFSVQENL